MKSTIYPRSKLNVGERERLASLLGGGALLFSSLLRPSRLSVLKFFGGGYLIYRGLSGNCLVYEAMGIRRAGSRGQSGIQVDRALTINRPRPEVYAFWRDFENLPRFMKHLENVQAQVGRRSHWVARAPLGATVEWDAEILDERENEYIAWNSLPGSQVENSGTVVFRDAPGGRGTEIQVRLRYNPPGGSAAAALAYLFGEEPEQQIRDDLERFKQVIEAGQTATVKGQTSGRVSQVEEEREEIRRKRKKDVVQEASEESFPASDAPAWTAGGDMEA